MLRSRVIPVLLLRHGSLVKTVRFKRLNYIGDPCNTLRIFNELEVDELILLDIVASKNKRSPNLPLLKNIASECFMPLAYGGGIASLKEAKAVLDIGFEKVAINTSALRSPQLISELSSQYGSQAVIVSIDVKKRFCGKSEVICHDRRVKHIKCPIEFAKYAEKLGAGEILLTSVDREGTWSGLDLELVAAVAQSVSIPVIAHGGVGCVQDIEKAVNEASASAVGLGSLVVYQKKGMGVLVNFPDTQDLDLIIGSSQNEL